MVDVNFVVTKYPEHGSDDMIFKYIIKHLRIVRMLFQITFFILFFPMLVALFYCPYIVPWVFCDTCPVFFCPSKYLRRPVILLAGALALFSGRSFCSWVCPFGSMQDLVNSSSRKFSKSGDFKIRDVSWTKYIFLIISIVFLLQALGTLNLPVLNLIPPVSMYMPFVFFLFLFISAFTSRFWCRFVCPVGALLSIANKISLIKLTIKNKCIKCGICKTDCVMVNNEESIDADSSDCIRCGNCVSKCPEKAIKLSVRGRK